MKEPIIKKFNDTDLPIVSLALSSNTLTPGELTRLADPGLTREFRSIPGVAEVIPVLPPYKLASREAHPQPSIVDVAGVKRNVNIGLLDSDDQGAQPGDWVLIHVGFAISKVDEQEAEATRRLLEGMGADYEQELEELKASAIE